MFFSLASATTFGSERDISVFVDENNFGFTHHVEANENFFIKVRIIDENSSALRNYHLNLKVEDSRGVLIANYSQLEQNGKLYRILSDDNGFINFSFPINVCSAIQQDFCYNVDEAYTLRLIQNNLDRRETFFIIPQTLEHNWIGQGLIFGLVNTEYIFIVLILFIILISLIATGFWLWKKRR